MERMKRLQEENEEEEASQEEMATRFEKEKKESLMVVTGGNSNFICNLMLIFRMIYNSASDLATHYRSELYVIEVYYNKKRDIHRPLPPEYIYFCVYVQFSI